MVSQVFAAATGAGVAQCLDDMAAKLGRKLRVYVLGHKERPLEEVDRMMKVSDMAVELAAWQALDDRSRYEWVNE
jgi:hypothetical protein